MKDYVMEMQKAGRITIPAVLRNELGLDEGSKVILRQENGEIKLLTQKQLIEEARQILRQGIPQGIGSVDDFLTEREKEASAEIQELDAQA
jgi:AbrB family looped-hinge helix DNA binding protein